MRAEFRFKTKSSRGPGFYKMNTAVLEDAEYQDLINDAYKSDSDKGNMAIWWDMMKVRVVTETKRFCKKKREKLRKEIDELRKEVLCEENNDQWIILNDKLQVLVDELNKGVMIRSREKNILNEDRPTAYFYRLEDERQSKEKIEQIHDVDSNGKVIRVHKGEREVMAKLYEHHKDFYSRKEIDEDALQHYVDSIPLTISSEQRDLLSSVISEKELWDAIVSMKGNRTPGKDGIPVEFYKNFFELLKYDMLRLFNEVYRSKC